MSLPGVGTAMGFGGARDASTVYYTFTSFTAPATVYRYDIATGVSAPFREVTLPFDPTQFETRQVFVPSKDGTPPPAAVSRGPSALGRLPPPDPRISVEAVLSRDGFQAHQNVSW